MELENHLADLRRQRGLGAAELARQAGISRQAIYALEAGTYTPSAVVALRLAQALEVPVEQLFRLADNAPAAARKLKVDWLSDLPAPAGVPVQLCRVGKHWAAVPAMPVPQYLPPADGVLATGKSGQTMAEPVHEPREDRLLVAGCDPAMSVLAHHAAQSEVSLVLAPSNSSQALTWLSEGRIHLAGTHLSHDGTAEANLEAVRHLLPKTPVAVITFAEWEEGLVLTAGNPRSVRCVADLVQPGLRLINREPGSGARRLLDAQLKQAGIKPAQLAGYKTTAAGHLAAAWHIHAGFADAGVATRAAARAFGLDFLPLTTERYDLVLHQQHMALPAMVRLLETLQRAHLRRELESLGGYETRHTGQRLV